MDINKDDVRVVMADAVEKGIMKIVKVNGVKCWTMAQTDIKTEEVKHD